MSSLFDLTGKVAIVTGSTKGIGLAIATRMAEHGATVVISSRKPDSCEAVAAGIRDKGGKAVVIPCHIARKEELQDLVDQTVARCGGIDILVENAGVNPYLGPSAGMPDEAYERVMGSNVRSNLWLANMTIPHMVKRGGGAIVIISSIGGLRGTAQLGAYAISKAADMQLARNIAVEWGRRTSVPTRLRPVWYAQTLPVRYGKIRYCIVNAPRTPRCSGSASPMRSPARPCSWPRMRAASPPVRPS
jgi:NAD(P)-dependent dehydrogenase (short-subunit alcohol dehydrogenase family)